MNSEDSNVARQLSFHVINHGTTFTMAGNYMESQCTPDDNFDEKQRYTMAEIDGFEMMIADFIKNGLYEHGHAPTTVHCAVYEGEMKRREVPLWSGNHDAITRSDLAEKIAAEFARAFALIRPATDRVQPTH